MSFLSPIPNEFFKMGERVLGLKSGLPYRRTTPINFLYAQNLRHEPTEAEAKLWTYLRTHRINGIHFRRQHAIGKYIVDFYAPSKILIIEVDGSQHIDKEIQDQERTDYLEKKGYRILRFWNHEVLNNLDGVIKSIQQAIIEIDKS